MSKPAVRTVVRSVIFAWLDLLRMESSESKARRGAAWMWPKEGGLAPAQHGARERREVSLVEITTYHGGAPGGRGYLGGKKIPPNWPWMELGRCAPQMASPEALVRF
jgi:hypothetical protein